MAAATFQEAREIVIRQARARAHHRPLEEVTLESAIGRVLAEPIAADRDVPALARSIRDGYAVRAADLPGSLEIAGEVRAGQTFPGRLEPGQAIEIMTGAPVPAGADAVVMIEHTRREHGRARIEGLASPGQFIDPQGSIAAAHAIVLEPGKRIDYSDVALLASIGRERVRVHARPLVAILPTGDEIVEAGQAPEPYQVRNSNSYALAAQVVRAGGIARRLPIARDDAAHTRELIEEGLQADLLLLSGGVSAGRYDLVEPVLAAMGAEFYFDRVLIQPGQPAVFGRVREKFFFGLPGNPASTMVTFEIFARAAVELLGGRSDTPLHMPLARLTRDFRHRPGLTRFLPACLSADGAEVEPVEWHGSGDIPALSRANAFLVTDSARAEYARGELIQVLLK